MFLSKNKVHPEPTLPVKTESPSRHIQFLDELASFDINNTVLFVRRRKIN